MTREEAKDLTLSILIVVAVLLMVDNIWLHCKCSSQQDELATLEQRLELHVNPLPGPTMKERAKKAYDKAKDAVKCGYHSVKGKISD